LVFVAAESRDPLTLLKDRIQDSVDHPPIGSELCLAGDGSGLPSAPLWRAIG
jgi:hypothetical protein